MSDQEMIVYDENGRGVIFGEKRELKRWTSDNRLISSYPLPNQYTIDEDQVLIHTRSIGAKQYIVKKMANQDDDCGVEEIIETNMTVEEIEAFHFEWNKKWKKSANQDDDCGAEEIIETNVTEEEMEVLHCKKSGGIKKFFKRLLRLE